MKARQPESGESDMILPHNEVCFGSSTGEGLYMPSQELTTGDGVSINMFELKSGGGRDMLMLHGVARAGRTFSGFAAMLPDELRISAIDFRGHGQSGRADSRYHVTDYVHDAITALEAIGRPTILYGHSLGSLVAAAVSAQMPDAVSAIILEDPPSATYWQNLATTNYYPTFVAMRKWAGRMDLSSADIALLLRNVPMQPTADGRTVKLGDVRDAVSLRFTASCVRQLDPKVMQAILEDDWQRGYDSESIFTAIRCPTLLLRGNTALGGMLPADDADRMAGQLFDCTRIDFPTAGHLLHWQMRSEASLQTAAFIESL
ncbi:MAG: alpha/beta hydrolase [Planctomycetaceae bacterium]